ncbi:multidrug efflux SMR transporter [Pikeienuella piscinae]|uniref:Multidrug efflux SMR transporter n=1 Tax=Pikeienuella piscinae TaxID=2748098 RepID=A0A7L5BX11_9RHOB|nr:multidrug efflux SMR transporter [Pikeienuella piscinae]QIE54424.1 multidrug efflux SMR transporter [Pikeienuella piscinae]
MPPVFASYLALGGAILCEVTGSALLLKSEQFTRVAPTVLMALFYIGSFYLLSLALRSIPLGVAYAIWAGLGVVLTAAISTLFFRQSFDLAAWVGIGFIVTGVVILNGVSRSTGH